MPPSYASGSKSKSRAAYDEQIEKLEAALRGEKELQDKLDKATRPKTRRPIEKALDDLRKGDNGILGHLKKIKQGWPNGCPME